METSDGEMVVDNDETVNVIQTNRCVHLTLRILFSTPGLCVIVILYSLMGAAIFPFFEAPLELHNTLAVIKSREECLRELWTITGKLKRVLFVSRTQFTNFFPSCRISIKTFSQFNIL